MSEFLGNIKGPAGADGKSAYDIAVENGFTGTEEEFTRLLTALTLYKGVNLDSSTNNTLDFDALENGTVYFMTSPSGNSAPTTTGGTVYTMQSESGSNAPGMEQWYITQGTAHWYYRRRWGSSNAWEAWVDRFYLATAFSPLSTDWSTNNTRDFDALPNGSTYYMTSPSGNNAPTTLPGIAYTMQTNTGGNTAGAEQWYITQGASVTTRWYYRIRSGSTAAWGSWIDRFDLTKLYAPLNTFWSSNDSRDFDTLANGSVYFMLTPVGNNAPSTESGIAFTMQTSAGANESSMEQWYITQGNIPHWYYRRRYGGTAAWEAWIDRLEVSTKQMLPGTLYRYNTVGCLGDSFTAAGDPSYPTTLSKMFNITVNNYGIGGATTETWLNSYTAVDACDAYILAFGINDVGVGGTAYIGEVSDIGTDNNTFYGNYAKIINMVKAANSSADIFLCDPLKGTINSTINKAYIEAVKNLCKYYGDIYYAPVSKTGAWVSLPTPDNNHPISNIGYSTLANYVLCAIGNSNLVS